MLLSGAGLSKNWTGYLASEMWGAILSHRGLTEATRNLLRKHINFETALEEAEEQGFSEQDRASLRVAVRRAFDLHDRNLADAKGPWAGDEIFSAFLDRFVFEGRSTFLFTLNQDLLLERRIRPQKAQIVLPGLHRQPWWFSGPRPYAGMADIGPTSVSVTTPSDDLGFEATACYYLKLHGSMDWVLPDGKGLLIVGGGKQEAINRHEILKRYNESFRAACGLGGVRLMVIGYGFQDRHINFLLQDAATNADLKLFIVDVAPPLVMRELMNRGGTPGLWNAVVGYTTRPFLEVVGGRTGEGVRVIEDYFGS
jgi:SIR2-like domain